MYIVLNYDLGFDDTKVGAKYSFNTNNFYKRNYTESIAELIEGGCIDSNFDFGDSLYFYNIKDSLNSHYENEAYVYTMNVFEEIKYEHLASLDDHSLIRLYKFFENFDSIIENQELLERCIREIATKFNFIHLIKAYTHIIKLKDEGKDFKGTFDMIADVLEKGIIERSYNETFYSLCYLSDICTKHTVNKRLVLSRFKEVVSSGTFFNQEILELKSSLYQINDLDMRCEMYIAYIQSLISRYCVYIADEALDEELLKITRTLDKEIDYMEICFESSNIFNSYRIRMLSDLMTYVVGLRKLITK